MQSPAAGNHISDDGASLLGSVLAKNSTLTSLNIDSA